MAERQGTPRSGRAVRVRYTAVGLIVAGIWLSSSNQPLWVHAVRTLTILLIVPAVLTPVGCNFSVGVLTSHDAESAR
jgi:hypothetical protein